MSKTLIFLLSFVCITSCAKQSQIDLSQLNGYWEIVSVKKDNTILKAYTVNTAVDYFEIQTDFSGFKKKVSPTLDGKYLVSKDVLPFKVFTDDDIVYLQYQLDDTIIKETLVKLTETELIIENTEGLSYTYKPFISLNLNP